MQQQILGIVAPVPKGEWTPLANYQKLNIVRRNGASYMATAANTDIQPGVDPGWESYWMLLNEDGQGEEGDQGPAGPGVPTGGLQGEVLVKSSNTNYDTDWVPQSQIAAGSAENDGNGNNIPDTYETKSDANAKNTNLQNQVTQNAQNIEQNAQNIEQNAQNIEQNAQIGARNAKRLDGLEQRINPSPFVTDSTVAYQKDVPSNAVGAVELQAIGGMTYRDAATNTLKNSSVTAVKSVGANLLNNTKDSASVGGVSLTRGSDGTSVILSGTATGNNYVVCGTTNLGNADYIISGGTQDVGVFIFGRTQTCFGSAVRVDEDDKNKIVSWGIRIRSGVTYNNYTIYPMLNAGSTAQPYTPYVEHTLPIPEAVQALDGWGQGIDATYNNHIAWSEDGTEKTYNKMVGMVDMGTLDWSLGNVFYAPLYSRKIALSNFICSKYQNANVPFGSMNDKTITGSTGYTDVYVKDTSYTDVASFKAAMAGVMLVYELANPIVTDISDLITSDNLLPVQGNGVLIFENENSQAVPSTVEFITAEATA